MASVTGAVTCRAVVLALEGKEVVNGLNGDGVVAPDEQHAASGQSVGSVSDPVFSGRHHRCSRNPTGVDEAREREVSARERARHPAHMGPDLRHSGRILRITLEADSPTIGQ